MKSWYNRLGVLLSILVSQEALKTIIIGLRKQGSRVHCFFHRQTICLIEKTLLGYPALPYNHTSFFTQLFGMGLWHVWRRDGHDIYYLEGERSISFSPCHLASTQKKRDQKKGPKKGTKKRDQKKEGGEGYSRKKRNHAIKTHPYVSVIQKK